MESDKYQELCRETAVYPDATMSQALSYLALGINGEAGEVAEKVKKIIRDKSGNVSLKDEVEIAMEVGDLLWYCAELLSRLKYKMSETMDLNVDKLQSRLKRGKLHGSGDER